MPFVILPFRPIPQSTDCKNFIRNYFKSHYEGKDSYPGMGLQHDLKLTEPLVRLTENVQWEISSLLIKRRLYAALLNGAGADCPEGLLPGTFMSCFVLAKEVGNEN